MQLKVVALFILSLIVTGCANVMNPYHSSFQCPHVYQGQCVSLQKAYQKSVHNTDGKPVSNKKAKKADAKQIAQTKTTETDYNKALYKKLASLLKSPVTPIVVPPKVIRILILPYRTKSNDFEMSRYVYFFATKPSWILSK